MTIVLWDASGLVKRYFREAGSEVVDAIYHAGAVAPMSVTFWGYAECFAILRRKYNGSLISAEAYSETVTALQQEVLLAEEFKLLTINDDRVLAGLSFVVRHNLNSNDAAILATYLRYQSSLPPGSSLCLLVTADQRLMRASEAEGLAALNPERVSPAEVITLLMRNV